MHYCGAHSASDASMSLRSDAPHVLAVLLIGQQAETILSKTISFSLLEYQDPTRSGSTEYHGQNAA